MKNIIVVLSFLFIYSGNQNNSVLVFTKTAGYRQGSIDIGVDTTVELGRGNCTLRESKYIYQKII